MKNILLSSVVAATACFAMLGQANAAPQPIKPHAPQVHHQKEHAKVNNKHKPVYHGKQKVVAPKHQPKKADHAPHAKIKHQQPNYHRG
ncbi:MULTISPECIES: hypothetical protein [Psychrobacter]|uniref:hypothetical protein n=1 Tax=Psychrobacter TaxID=497 RepID=UPI00146E344E|nr:MULTISPECIES: hypothetical protein [Psychrobacter]